MSWLFGALGAGEAAITSAMNYKIAKENRDWQERMSNTSMQRRKADLVASNINPILGLSSQGASTPPGNVAQMDFRGGAASAMAGKRTSNESKVAKQNVATGKTQAAMNTSAKGLNNAKTQTEAYTQNVAATTSARNLMDAERIAHTRNQAAASADIEVMRRNMYKDNPYLMKIQALAPAVSSAAALVGAGGGGAAVGALMRGPKAAKAPKHKPYRGIGK